MNKKATLSAAVLLAMGITAPATADRGHAGNSRLDIPLPGTAEYESASNSEVEDLLLAKVTKKKAAPKKKTAKKKKAAPKKKVAKKKKAAPKKKAVKKKR